MEPRKRQLAVSRVGRAPKGALRRLQEGVKRRRACGWVAVLCHLKTTFWLSLWMMFSAVLGVAGDDKSHTYGAVKSMDHFGRTCMVHWMTPYDEGQGDRWVSFLVL